MKAGATSATWSTLESKSGTQHIRRIYDSGFAASFNDQGSTGIDIVYSFKPDMSLIAAQDSATITKLQGLIDSITTSGRTVYIGPWHEPENDFTTTGQKTTYVNGWRVFADLVHNNGNPLIKTCWIMMSFSWLLSSSREPEDWYPGDTYVDMVGVDNYNEGSLHDPQRWDSWGLDLGEAYPGESKASIGGGYIHGGFFAWVASRSKPWGIAEWGSIRSINVPANPDFTADAGLSTSRADWIRSGADYLAGKGATFLCYFDTDGRDWAGTPTESWQLANTPSDVDYGAWADVTTAHTGSEVPEHTYIAPPTIYGHASFDKGPNGATIVNSDVGPLGDDTTNIVQIDASGTAATPVYSTDALRGFAAKFVQAASSFKRFRANLSPASATFSSRMVFKISALPTTATYLEQLRSVSTVGCGVQIAVGSGGTSLLRMTNGSTALGTGYNTPIVANTWYCYEHKVNFGTTEQSMRVTRLSDGVVLLDSVTATNITAAIGTMDNFLYGGCSLGGTLDFYIDEYVCSLTDQYFGTPRWASIIDGGVEKPARLFVVQGGVEVPVDIDFVTA